jgi:hypothetical protein
MVLGVSKRDRKPNRNVCVQVQNVLTNDVRVCGAGSYTPSQTNAAGIKTL